MSRSTHIEVEVGQNLCVRMVFWNSVIAEKLGMAFLNSVTADKLGMALREERVLYGADARAVLITAIAADQGHAAMLGLLLEQSRHTNELVRVAVTYLD